MSRESVPQHRYLDYVIAASIDRVEAAEILEMLKSGYPLATYLSQKSVGDWVCIGCYAKPSSGDGLKRAARKDAWLIDSGLEVEVTSRRIRPQKNGQSGYLIYARVKVSGT